jgi:hypothetical protein
MNSHKITNLGAATLNTDMVSKAYTDNIISIMNGAASEIVNPLNSDSSLTAGSTQLLAGTVPLNMNAQKIINVPNPTAATDILNR